MSLPRTPILGLAPGGTADEAFAYANRVNFDNTLNSALLAIDAHVGNMTGSCYSIFCPVTGAVGDLSIGNAHQAAGVLGQEYNRSGARVIQEVVVYAAASGSNPNAVVRVDVQVQNAANDPRYSSVFSNSTFKPAYSGSTGFGAAKSSTFVSGSNQVWLPGTLMLVKADLASGQQAGLNAMAGLTVQVFWKPSGSYGA